MGRKHVDGGGLHWFSESPWRTMAVIFGVVTAAVASGVAIPAWLDRQYTPRSMFQDHRQAHVKTERDFTAQLIEGQLAFTQDRIQTLEGLRDDGKLSPGQARWLKSLERRRDDLTMRLSKLRELTKVGEDQ